MLDYFGIISILSILSTDDGSNTILCQTYDFFLSFSKIQNYTFMIFKNKIDKV